MATPDRAVKISKYLSKHLRHAPERIGLTLEAGGWVEVSLLLAALARNRFPVSLDELRDVVAGSDKQRFSFSEDGLRIRANQGHSVEVDLELRPQVPPDELYHGTGHGAVASIQERGLLRMGRHHVHLSRDQETARRVGMRHGRPSIFVVDTAAMTQDGFTFYCADNGVWLVDHVPVQYLRLLP